MSVSPRAGGARLCPQHFKGRTLAPADSVGRTTASAIILSLTQAAAFLQQPEPKTAAVRSGSAAAAGAAAGGPWRVPRLRGSTPRPHGSRLCIPCAPPASSSPFGIHKARPCCANGISKIILKIKNQTRSVFTASGLRTKGFGTAESLQTYPLLNPSPQWFY